MDRLIPGRGRHDLLILCLSVAASSFFISCARDLSRRYPTVLSEYDSILDRQNRIAGLIETDRRIFDFQLRRGLFSVEGEGVFLYQRPVNMRLDLYLGTSELVFQYVRNGEEACAFLPAGQRILASEGGWVNLGGLEGLEGMRVRDDELKTMMLGLFDLRGEIGNLSEVRQGNSGYLLSLLRGDEVSYLLLDRETGLLSTYLVLSDGRKVREVDFSSYAKIDGVDRPRSTKYRDEDLGVTIRVSIRSETLNERVDSSLFSLPHACSGR